MTEVIPGGDTKVASGDEGKKDLVAHETYLKVLDEKKKFQAQAAENKAKLDQYEQEKLESEGKLKEALEAMKVKNAELQNNNVSLVKGVVEANTKSQYQRVLDKLGCVDAEAAIALTKFDDLEVVDGFKFEESKLEAKAQELVKAKGYLFKKDFKLPKDIQPNSASVPEKSFKDMSTAELISQYKQISLKS
jgi:hypothetical protein